MQDVAKTSQAAVPLRVLIAEDDQLAGAICARALSNAGYDVSLALDGRAALGMLNEGSFDVVVTDMVMPAMDGLELVRAMRGDPRLTRLPVVFLTSCSEHEMRVRGYRAGCDAYLVKPARPVELVECVASLVSRALGTGARLGDAYLSGRLDGTSVASLLSFLHVQERSGLLRLWRFGAYGEIAMLDGQLLTASVEGTLLGEDALAALVGWNAGTFRFERHDVSELEPQLLGMFTELIARSQGRQPA